jgi:dTDP-4-amino-4,6-dideoxygalactose transaminase
MKPLHIAASPNVEQDDFRLAVKTLLTPWAWGSKHAQTNLIQAVGKELDSKHVYYLDSARSALMVALKAMGIGPGDEVIVTAFTCLVVVNPITWLGAKPIYVDINKDTFNYNLRDLQAKVSPRTKAVIVQHTFGIADDVKTIRKIVGDQVQIIEDLAHSFGNISTQGKLGTLGDAAIITFGIEKVISGVRGGMVTVKSEIVGQELDKLIKGLPAFPRQKEFIALINPIFWYLVLPLYNLGIGKLTLGRAVIWFAHQIRLLGNVIEDREYQALKPDWLPALGSPILAKLALNQYRKLDKFSKHRQELSEVYANEFGNSELGQYALLRYPLLVKKRNTVFSKLKKQNVVLGDWYSKILYAPVKALDLLSYKPGSCPVAEEVTKTIINLPTFIRVGKSDARRIAKDVKQYI